MLFKLNKHFITEVISVVSINNRNYSTVKLKENKSTKKIGEPSVSKEEPKEIKTRASTKNINQESYKEYVRDSQALIRSLANQDVQIQNTKKTKISIAKNVQNPAVSEEEGAFKQIVFKKAPKNSEIPRLETSNFFSSVKVDSQRQEIERRLKQEREQEKHKIAAKYFNLIDELKLNTSFLETMNRYPMNLTLDISTYDEVELKLASDKMFQSSHYYDINRWKFPSVTTVLNVAQPEDKRKNLMKWQADKIEKLSYEGYKSYTYETTKKGHDFHKAAEMLLRKQPINKDELDTGIVKSVDTLKKIIEQEFKNDMVLIEEKVFHNALFYNGRLDCLGYYKDCFCLIDWKRSDRSKSELKDMYDSPVQTSAYIGAFLNDPTFEEIRKKHKLSNALLINITNTGEANFHVVNFLQIEFYWYQWLSYLQTFWRFVCEERKKIKDE